MGSRVERKGVIVCLIGKGTGRKEGGMTGGVDGKRYFPCAGDRRGLEVYCVDR